MSSQFNLSTGELRHLSISSRNSLMKIAGISPIVGKIGKGLFNYGMPAAVGGAVAYNAHEDGIDPVGSGVIGLGAGGFALPGNWRDVWKDSEVAKNLGRSKSSALFNGAIKNLAVKGGLTTAGVLGDKSYDIVNNIQKATANFAQQSAPIADGIVNNLNGMQDTMQNIASGQKVMGSSLENASNTLAQMPHELKKGLIGAGIGGAGLVGGGLLLRHFLKQHEHKNHQVTQ